MASMTADFDHQKNYWADIRFFALLGIIFLLLTACVKGPDGHYTFMQFDQRNFDPLLRFLTAVSYIVGLWLILSGLYSLKRYGQMRTMMMSQVHITGPLMKLLAGLMLYYMPAAATAFIYSVWGTTNLASWDEGVVPSWADQFRPIVHLMRLVGYAAFIRGWVLMARLGKEGGQPGGFGKAFMHIFGGVLSINFVGTIKMIQNTFT